MRCSKTASAPYLLATKDNEGGLTTSKGTVERTGYDTIKNINSLFLFLTFLSSFRE